MCNSPKNELIEKILANEMGPIIVSACLLGVKCVYDGSSNENSIIVELSNRSLFIPICPEQLGGLPTPRIPQCIESGSGEDVLKGKTKVINRNSEDVSVNFIKGAQEALLIAKINKVKLAILKENSPSCGVNFINNKNDDKETKTGGSGVTTALLKQNGLKVLSENDLL